MKKGNAVLSYTRFVILVLIVAMCGIFAKYIVAHVVFGKYGITGAAVGFFLYDDPNYRNVVQGEKNNRSIKTSDPVTNWRERYPFAKEPENLLEENEESQKTLLDKYSLKMGSIINKAETYVNDEFLYKEKAIVLTQNLLEAMDWHYSAPTMRDTDRVIRMENGYLTYETEYQPQNEFAASIYDFKCFLDKMGIPLIYVNAGSKVCPYDREIPPGCKEYTNENGDELLNYLSQYGVKTIDMREKMIEDHLDWYGCYYKTDHHWTTNMGIWSAGIIAQELNEHYGFSYDLNQYNEDNYRITHYGDYWLGGEGRAIASTKVLDDYDLILPLEKTDLTVRVPSAGYEAHGEYQDVVIDLEELAAIDDYDSVDYLIRPDAYAAIIPQNQAVTEVVNHGTCMNPDKKVLFLRDSFSWYTTSFLALQEKCTQTVVEGDFDGSVRAFIEQERPDMVIIMLCENTLSPAYAGIIDFQ